MPSPADQPHFSPASLRTFATNLFTAAGMDADKAATVAELLIQTDMLGRRTHGLAMAVSYLAGIAKGTMRTTGQPTVIKDTGATVVWDGDYLPGQWLMSQAIDLAMPRAAKLGVVTFAIRRSHHIGCLATLAKRAADRGFVALIANSDPAGKRVAPYGGTEALFTPNPFAIGYPGSEHPVLVDICASITTTSMTRDKHAAGEQFEFPWLLDADGTPTRDPAVLEHTTPKGSLQLIGGQDHGHKGFGLALMIEALSQGLSGHGRLDAPTRWGGNTFLQVLDPDLFAGRDAFAAQMNSFSDQCRSNRPIRPDQPVRVPGDQAARNVSAAEAAGISYPARTWAALTEAAAKLGVKAPSR
jgi:LDH2 family malate/lactate/ureidoglycolate dehydrogenase